MDHTKNILSFLKLKDAISFASTNKDQRRRCANFLGLYRECALFCNKNDNFSKKYTMSSDIPNMYRINEEDVHSSRRDKSLKSQRISVARKYNPHDEANNGPGGDSDSDDSFDSTASLNVEICSLDETDNSYIGYGNDAFEFGDDINHSDEDEFIYNDNKCSNKKRRRSAVETTTLMSVDTSQKRTRLPLHQYQSRSQHQIHALSKDIAEVSCDDSVRSRSTLSMMSPMYVGGSMGTLGGNVVGYRRRTASDGSTISSSSSNCSSASNSHRKPTLLLSTGVREIPERMPVPAFAATMK